MSLHKLTAGSGHDYLTRQVAVQDSTEKGYSSLASYYSEKGEVPGTWIGAGVAGIAGLDRGDEVTAGQMKALFGHGFHPLAQQRLAALAPGASDRQVRAAQRLGTPFKVFSGDVPPFNVEVARRVEDLKVATGEPRTAPVSVDVRARVRSEVAAEFFTREHGREPANARELAAAVARYSRPRTTAVAGYDMTFSPVKSVSALWAIADPRTAAKIELAHDAAVRDALSFLEQHALFTRTGTHGVRQVDVTGLVAAVFVHRDSRAGDPDLHTHVAVSNKVQALDGRWLAIDGRVLFKANVAASETYNTALEHHLRESLGVVFAPRDGGVEVRSRKRPVREIVGIDAGLNERWSTRRAVIDVRRSELVTAFQAAHGRPPTPVEAIKLSQQATLETRDAKHEPRSLAEQREQWRAQAIDVLGSSAALEAMVSGALAGHRANGERVTSHWVDEHAARVVEVVQQRRSTWQVWHLRAEALRQVRGVNVPPDHVDAVVALLVDAALARSVLVATDRDSVNDPDDLRRADGTSVYHVAGSDLFTSAKILHAEQRIVATAGQFDGAAIEPHLVDLALADSAAAATELNPGQAALVRAMACSGARVQLGIAAAGTGKTTAMSALTRAWEEAGGTVVGLAPSAAAAAALREQIDAKTDTMAKLLHAIETGETGQLPGRIDATTLVLIDEAGMADTLSLDAAISFVIERGGSVRLIGDDQQLAAIGAGGVLRDIDATHGALRLSELLRFSDPAEGAASLALREGLPESLGYYLDNQRIGVGDQTTEVEELFTAWKDDRDAGLDALMLAPTRELVTQLNVRARTDRITANSAGPGQSVSLADGTQASVGDVVITRHNDRRLRLSATDWVKNGDRWTVTAITDGRLSVEHATSGLRCVLPQGYVRAHTELGYASTVHTAQGVTADTVHGLVTGTESRQQLYTMLTRGRLRNDLYLAAATDGDPHNLIRPETINPPTATDILESILARDDSPVSATSTARICAAPATQLSLAAPRYLDALNRAAERVVGADRANAVEQVADDLVPGIVDEPAWPVLRSHLILLEAHGRDAVRALSNAVADRDLDGAADRAAILDWRLDPTGHRNNATNLATAPLAWMPAIPTTVAEHPGWGPSVLQRAAHVKTLADQVRRDALAAQTPVWARQAGPRPADQLLAEVSVWRAANSIATTDRRPTGPPQRQKATAIYQRRLDEQLRVGRAPALAEWGPLIDDLHPRRDDFTPLLAERLAAISRAGIDTARLFATAAAEGPLPDDHVAAAMWWRINRHLSPAVATQATGHDDALATRWGELLIDTLGDQRAGQVKASAWWPTLVASIERASSRGWATTDLLELATTASLDDVDPAQALMWRIAIITDPPPEPSMFEENPAPEDLDQAVPANSASEQSHPFGAADELTRAKLERAGLGPVQQTDTEVSRLLERAFQWDHAPVSGDRILQINTWAADFFEQQFAGSWAQAHLRQRLGQDLCMDPRYRPGYAPQAWTALADHLHQRGVSDDELLAAGVATTSSSGRLIDRFRDRAILPIISHHAVLGFVGRRNPDSQDGPKSGPKYLNTPGTIVFHKGAQLYGTADPAMTDGSIPVLVEGPIDAIAVTLATGGAYVGVAPLGTSLTHEQARQLADLDSQPIVATDGDLAGRIAAERDYWMLTPHLTEPHFVALTPGDDPAGLLENHGPISLIVALQQAKPLADALLAERITNLDNHAEVLHVAAQVIAAQPDRRWPSAIETTAAGTGIEPLTVSHAVADAAALFNHDPRRFCDDRLAEASAVRARIERADGASPASRWSDLARSLDSRLTSQPDWAATATMMQEIHDSGRDVPELTRQLVHVSALGGSPAQDLRYRLVAYLPEEGDPDEPTFAATPPRQPENTPQPNRPAAPKGPDHGSWR